MASTWDTLERDSRYKTKDAETAFSACELVRSEITHDNQRRRTIIHTNGIGYDYVEFVMELAEEPSFAGTADDGIFVRANVYSFDGELIVRNRRMAFAKGTPPYDAVLKQKRGAFMKVLGTPRMNVAVIAWRVAQRNPRPEVLRWNLPYEMIITAFYEVVEWEEENE
jgi:hypothetical protein